MSLQPNEYAVELFTRVLWKGSERLTTIDQHIEAAELIARYLQRQELETEREHQDRVGKLCGITKG